MIFIEIGAHHGQSTEIALNPRYGFKEFLLFEPSTNAIKYLKTFKDPRIKIFEFGLSNQDGEVELVNSGAVGASIFPNKYKEQAMFKEKIVLKQASRVLSQYLHGSKVFIRINCEGSEVLILENLLESKLLNQQHSILVDFDIVRFDPLYPIHRILEGLNKTGVRSYQAEYFGELYNKESVQKWLDYELIGLKKHTNLTTSFRYKTKSYFYRRRRIYKLCAQFIPKKIKAFVFKKLRQIKLTSNFLISKVVKFN